MAASGEYVEISNSDEFYASFSLMKSLLSIEKTKAKCGWRNSDGDLMTRTWIDLLYFFLLFLTPLCHVNVRISAASPRPHSSCVPWQVHPNYLPEQHPNPL